MKLFLAGSLLLAAVVPAIAATPDIPTLAAAYGARPTAWNMRISPSGDKMLYFTPSGSQGVAVVVADIATGGTKILLSSDKATTVPYSCGWKSEQRIVCRIDYTMEAQATRTSFRRAMSIAVDGSSRVMLGQRASDQAVWIDQDGARVIDWLPDDPDHVLMRVAMVEHVTIGSNIASRGSGITVQKVDVNTGKMVVVERSNPVVMDYDSDNQGRVRYMEIGDSTSGGEMRDTVSYLVRSKDSKDWRQVATGKLSGRPTWRFLGFDETGDSMFVVRDMDGRGALFRDPVDAGGAGGLVFADARVDVDDLLRIGKYQRPVAAINLVDDYQYKFFDPMLEKRTRALSAALPGKPKVMIFDESWDGTRDIVFAGGVEDPGQYYRYETTTKHLSPLLSVRPAVAKLAAGVQTSVHYPASGGVQVPGFLTVPAGPTVGKRPAIIMPHGGPDSREIMGFDWMAQYFTQLGYVVLQPNFRGSSGYGEEWYAKNGFKGWETAIGDINSSAHWLVSQGIADPARIAIMGWGYGGYAALQANVMAPSLYKAVVAMAPVTDLTLLKRTAQQFTNAQIVALRVGEGPHVVAGSPAQNAARITAPVLMFHGDKDLEVDIDQSRTMDSALQRAKKQHELVVYPGLTHSLDDSVARIDMLTRSAQFLAAAMAPK